MMEVTALLLEQAARLERDGLSPQAELVYRQILADDPGHAGAAHAFGRLLHRMGRMDEGLAWLRQAVDLDPDAFDAWHDLGAALGAQEHLAEAVQCFRRALALRHDIASGWHNLGSALNKLERYDDAAAAHRQAIALQPDLAEAHSDLGVALYKGGRAVESIAACRGAVTLAPAVPEFHVNLALALLMAGHYEEGFREFEWRRRTAALRVPMAGVEWRGEPLDGRTVLLHAEQGLGDILQFVRYAPLVVARGGRVVLWVDRPLVRLLGTVPGVAEVAPIDVPPPPFAFYLPLPSLPRVLGTALGTIPADIPYVQADSVAVETWRRRLADRPGLKVGLVWAGAPRPHDPVSHRIDHRRSLRLDQFAGLAAIAGIALVSLQKGDPAAQTKTAPPSLRLADWTDEITDFADTAALVANLDLVISADTSVVHLAGAMGKPVWILSRFDGCWRWLSGRDDSPWYPTARLFRQPAPGDWETVLRRVGEELRVLAMRATRRQAP
ncbi:MAG: tetratricopeptide repeat-containing glycosyltransferase family protein [Magnetospirillum sp.]|nr:tetratricopeptide repeat-containing glycosyltransferase family protein [Magnetospirillum sp.]